MEYLRRVSSTGSQAPRNMPPTDKQGLLYGQTMFVLYAPDGRRWTANKEKEYPIKGEDYYYTRLVKRASHGRTDLCFAKVIEDGGGVINNLVGFVRNTASGREERDPRVMYGDKVVLWAWVDGGRYLRATSLVGWLQFCQSKPDIGGNACGDNVWIVKPMDPAKRGQQVSFGDTIVLESVKYPGYYVSEQVAPRGKYCRLTNDPAKAPLTGFQLGWSPNNTARGGIIPPFFSAKESEREDRETKAALQQAQAFGAMANGQTNSQSGAPAPAPARPTTGPANYTSSAQNALQERATNYAAGLAQQRYSSNPGQIFSDAQSVGQNKYFQSVASTVAKNMFSNGRS